MASPTSSPIDADQIASGAAPPPPEGGSAPADRQPSGQPTAPAHCAERALAIALERVGSATGSSGESIVGHARGTLAILDALRVDEPTLLASVLFGLGDKMPLEEVAREFGDEVRTLVDGMRQLLRLKDRTLKAKGASSGVEIETLRRMTLAMASDIRVVLLRLASRLQTLRHHAETRHPPESAVANETLEVLAPLANRLGLGQLKWELEDLAFRFLEPDLYKTIARQLEERRVEREAFIRAAVAQLRAELAAQGIEAEVSGRPKHIHSIYNKMRTKGLSFDEVQDLRAFRVLVGDIRDCYAVLGIVHQIWPPMPREFDDYISRPKANGYQSLHTVVTADDGRSLEIQIRTRTMHQHAEFGVASHWRYKESSTQLAGSPSSSLRDTKSASRGRPGEPSGSDPTGAQDARVEWMRQLLMWQQEVGATLGGKVATSAAGEERIYLLTPEARVIELPAGSTPVDFAYHVHTVLGHRCRGARVDGQLVPLHTALRNGQTVEIVAARSGSASEGPSRDWLNPQLGFVRSPRARAKVRQWFNALELERDLSAGREKVEKILQREGRTALAFDELARRMGFERPDDLFLAAAREEVGPRMLEEAVRAPADTGRVAGDGGRGASPRGAALADGGTADASERLPQRALRGGRGTDAGGSSVRVVGVDFLLTQLARCCRPAPPDPIVGFVTRGHGVSVHRAECRSFAELARRTPERVLETEWGDWEREPPAAKGGPRHSYPVDVVLRARDRQGLLRDVSDVFARDRLNVTAVQTLSRAGVAQMQFTVEVPGIPQLKKTLIAVRDVDGVIECRRK
jgi:GTP pyrophosphokinase